jgi:hypothetical protein
MLIDAMRIVARETGFTVIDHALGFTAIRENDGGRLLFCLSTGRVVDNGETAKVTASGFGLASFVIAARQYFDLPAETAEAVQRAIEPEQLRHMASRSR